MIDFTIAELLAAVLLADAMPYSNEHQPQGMMTDCSQDDDTLLMF